MEHRVGSPKLEAHASELGSSFRRAAEADRPADAAVRGQCGQTQVRWVVGVGGPTWKPAPRSIPRPKSKRTAGKTRRR